MDFITNFFGWLIKVYFVSIPFIWLWAFYKDSLAKYPEMRERLQNLLEQGEKITPKQWKAEIHSLQSEYGSISREKSKTATELAYAEVISYNRKNLERELQNESRQQNGQQSRTKRREEEI